jgi:hypothetical protein
MLDRSTVKQLLEHNMLDLLRKDPNPSQKLLRMREQSDRAISELTLLASQLPKSTHVRIFNYTGMEKLVRAILEGNSNDRVADLQFEVEMSRIAAMLVRECVNYCAKLYTLNIEPNTTLNQTVLDRLTNAVELCEAIAFKTFVRQTESVGREEITHYLFNWDKIASADSYDFGGIKGEDNWNLIRFLNKELDERIDPKARKELLKVRRIQIEEGVRSKACYFLIEKEKGFRCYIDMKKDESELEVRITNLEGKRIPIASKKRLIVQKDSSNNHRYIFLHRVTDYQARKGTHPSRSIPEAKKDLANV